jgi:hypothetical protein
MSAKPPISVRRPSRPEAELLAAPQPIAHAAVPSIDPESADALAYTLRGRASAPDAGAAGDTAARPAAPDAQQLGADTGLDGAKGAADEEVAYISVKLPPEVSRKLSAVADRRGSKRTHVALEVLTQPLRDLAMQHRTGCFPDLPKVVSGSVRSSIAFVLPPDLATDLSYVLATRRAVKAQVIVRLLVPAIENLHAREFASA